MSFLRIIQTRPLFLDQVFQHLSPKGIKINLTGLSSCLDKQLLCKSVASSTFHFSNPFQYRHAELLVYLMKNSRPVLRDSETENSVKLLITISVRRDKI